MARGCIRPKRVIANGCVLGFTQGRQLEEGVVIHRFHPRSTWTERNRAYERMVMSQGWTDYNGIISDVTAGKFGRTYFMKGHTNAFTVANNWYDLWPVAGNPTSGTINGTAFTARQFDDTTTGALTHRGNVSTDWKFLLSSWVIATANTPMLMLYDRVLAYDLCTFNASANQTMTNTLTAQRYNSGAPGLLISVVVNTVNGSTATNLTQLRYTNQAGTTLQAMPTSPTVTFIPSAAAPSSTLGARVNCPITSGQTIPWTFALPLASGDTGARLINDYTTSAANTGTSTYMLMHPMGDLMVPVAAVPTELDRVFQITDMERIYDGACLAMMAYAPATTAAAGITGGIRYAW